MKAQQFYNHLNTLVDQNKIKNINSTLGNNFVIINASYFNFNVINHLGGLLLGIFISLINGAMLVLGVLIIILSIYNLFIDLTAVNKLVIDFSQRKIFLCPLHFLGKQEILFSKLSKFTKSDSGQVDFYNRARLNCNIKTGEKIILFDVSDEGQATELLYLFNSLLKIE